MISTVSLNPSSLTIKEKRNFPSVLTFRSFNLRPCIFNSFSLIENIESFPKGFWFKFFKCLVNISIFCDYKKRPWISRGRSINRGRNEETKLEKSKVHVLAVCNFTRKLRNKNERERKISYWSHSFWHNFIIYSCWKLNKKRYHNWYTFISISFWRRNYFFKHFPFNKFLINKAKLKFTYRQAYKHTHTYVSSVPTYIHIYKFEDKYTFAPENIKLSIFSTTNIASRRRVVRI